MSAPEHSCDTHSQWFALNVRTRYERTVERNLNDKGYESYVPCSAVTRPWADRVKISSVPLFPNYVFCRFDPRNKMPVVTTPQVYSIVGTSGLPTAIPSGQIDSIKRMVECGTGIEPANTLHTGELVQVIRGPLKGLRGTVLKVKNAWRLVVAVTLLQRGIAAEIDRMDVQKLADAA